MSKCNKASKMNKPAKQKITSRIVVETETNCIVFSTWKYNHPDIQNK
jgi:hypothetical protein